MTNKYTLRYSGGLVPDICQQFTKGMGVFANPTSDKSPAKLRLAFEAAPFGLLVEKAGGRIPSKCALGPMTFGAWLAGKFLFPRGPWVHADPLDAEDARGVREPNLKFHNLHS